VSRPSADDQSERTPVFLVGHHPPPGDARTVAEIQSRLCLKLQTQGTDSGPYSAGSGITAQKKVLRPEKPGPRLSTPLDLSVEERTSPASFGEVSRSTLEHGPEHEGEPYGGTAVWPAVLNLGVGYAKACRRPGAYQH
jgi:hypothetical protein